MAAPSAIEGTPHTNPYYWAVPEGNGLPGFDYHDVGIVVLSKSVTDKGYGQLPTAGQVDTLKMKTSVDLVGYGVQWQIRGGGISPYDAWVGLRMRFYAPAQIVGSENVMSDEFIRLTADPGQGKGGTAFGDSGGPVLLGGTNIVLAVNSFVTNANCAGVTYSQRIDIPEVLQWINGFLPPP